jgi:hypothetical protein
MLNLLTTQLPCALQAALLSGYRAIYLLNIWTTTCMGNREVGYIGDRQLGIVLFSRCKPRASELAGRTAGAFSWAHAI